MTLKSVWYDMRNKPYYNAVIMDNYKVIKEISQKKGTKVYIKFKKLGFLIPLEKDLENVFKIEKHFGTYIFYNLDNALPLKDISHIKNEELNEKRKKQFKKDDFITYISSISFQNLLEEHSIRDIIASEETLFEKLKPIIIISIILFFIAYLIYLYG